MASETTMSSLINATASHVLHNDSVLGTTASHVMSSSSVIGTTASHVMSSSSVIGTTASYVMSNDSVIGTEMPNVTTGPVEEYWETRVAVFLYACPSILFLIVGTVGNALSFIVFSQKTMRQSVTSVYFRVLAVSDTVVLFSGSLVFFILGAFGLDIRLASQVSCKFWIPVLLASCYHSCWILVFIAVDRFIGVWAPHKYRRLCSQRRAVIGMVVLFCVVTATVAGYWATILEINPTGTACGIAPRYLDFFLSVYQWLDMTLLNFIPTIALVGLNIGIIVKISRAIRTRHSVMGSTKTTTKVTSPTAIILSVSLVYVLCTIPTSTKFLVIPAFGSGPHAAAQGLLYGRSCETLYLFNHAVNFFLYCVHGSGFRKELRGLFRRADTKASVAGTNSTSLSASASMKSTKSRSKSASASFKEKYTKRDVH